MGFGIGPHGQPRPGIDPRLAGAVPLDGPPPGGPEVVNLVQPDGSMVQLTVGQAAIVIFGELRDKLERIERALGIDPAAVVAEAESITHEGEGGENATD